MKNIAITELNKSVAAAAARSILLQMRGSESIISIIIFILAIASMKI